MRCAAGMACCCGRAHCEVMAWIVLSTKRSASTCVKPSAATCSTISISSTSRQRAERKGPRGRAPTPPVTAASQSRSGAGVARGTGRLGGKRGGVGWARIGSAGSSPRRAAGPLRGRAVGRGGSVWWGRRKRQRGEWHPVLERSAQLVELGDGEAPLLAPAHARPLLAVVLRQRHDLPRSAERGAAAERAGERAERLGGRRGQRGTSGRACEARASALGPT